MNSNYKKRQKKEREQIARVREKCQRGTAFTRMLEDERKAAERDKERQAKAKKKKRKRRQQNPVGRMEWLKNGRVDYLAYINSPEWKAKRKKVLERAKHKCETCSAVGHLHVHHTTYRHLGFEPLRDLKALCPDCHAIEHEDKGCLDSLGMELKAIIG